MIAYLPPQQEVAAGTESLTFRIERPGLPVPSYTLTVGGDGKAVYQVTYPAETSKYGAYAGAAVAQASAPVTMDVVLSAATTTRLFERARSTGGFRKGCASKAKNVADTGAKTLTWISPAGTATCTFNYSEDKAVSALTASFQAIAFTLDEGRRLETKHRFDRLALDPESDYLFKAVKDGNAIEINTIALILQSLVDDPQVLERVRTRAAALLSQAAVTP